MCVYLLYIFQYLRTEIRKYIYLVNSYVKYRNRQVPRISKNHLLKNRLKF